MSKGKAKTKVKPRVLVVDGVRIPKKIAEGLRETLTEKGVHQWLHSRARYLKGQRPLDLLRRGDPKKTKKVIEAVGAYLEGSYL